MLTIEVEPMLRVSKLRLKGNKALDDDQVERAIAYASGQTILPDPEVLRALRAKLLAVYAERARIYYEKAAQALPAEERHKLRAAQAMGGIYRALLEELQSQGFPCLEQSLRLSKPRRIAIAALAFLGLGASA